MAVEPTPTYSSLSTPGDRDPDAKREEILDALRGEFPGLDIRPTDGWYILADALAVVATDLEKLLADRSDEHHDVFVEAFDGIARELATFATGTARFTVTAAATGLTIPTGTQLAHEGAGFATTAATAAISGAGTVDVAVAALQAGADGSGHQGTAEMIDAIPWITAVTLLAPGTVGGRDEETIDEFRDRVARIKQVRGGLTLPRHFELAALNVDGVGRAVALDLYDPGPPISTTAEGHLTVALATTDGLACSTGVKAAALATLDAQAVSNLAVHVLDPTYTTINVVATVKLWPDADEASTLTAAQDAVEALLDPGRWGLPDFGDSGSVAGWHNKPVVRAFEVAAAIDNVAGVDEVVSCTVNGSASVTMTGAAPLPQAGTVAVTEA